MTSIIRGWVNVAVAVTEGAGVELGVGVFARPSVSGVPIGNKVTVGTLALGFVGVFSERTRTSTPFFASSIFCVDICSTDDISELHALAKMEIKKMKAKR